jgi:phospholipid transport system substrate-binding protein
MRTKLFGSLALLAGIIAGGPVISANAGVAEAPGVTAASVAPAVAIGTDHASAPDVLLSAATAVVTARLKHEATPSTNSAGTVAELLETTILPLFDFHHMTRLAVARNWKLASLEQQTALIAEFRTLLVRTYYAALVNYRDEVIEYKALQLAPGATDVTVKSTVKKPGVERMTIDYDMDKSAAGWKVYDIRMAGISLTANYRTSFAEIIRDGGIDELIRFLTARNRQAHSGLRSDDSEARGLILLYGVVPSLLGGHQ